MNSESSEQADKTDRFPPFLPCTESWQELAQAGDQQALTDWLNHHLQPHAVLITELDCRQDALKISLESEDVPDQEIVVPLVHQCLDQLGIDVAKTATLYGQKIGSELPFWMDQITLSAAANGDLRPDTVNLKSVLAVEDPKAETKELPKGKLSFTHWFERQLQRFGGSRTQPDQKDPQINRVSKRFQSLKAHDARLETLTKRQLSEQADVIESEKAQINHPQEIAELFQDHDIGVEDLNNAHFGELKNVVEPKDSQLSDAQNNTGLSQEHLAGIEEDFTNPKLKELQDIQDAKQRAAARLVQEQYEAGIRDFTKRDLSDVNLQGATLSLANFQAAKLTWANFSGAGLWKANLSGANLRNANLRGASLQGANLQGADLQEADLSGANLSWAVLSGANLTNADLTDVNLTDANLERVIMPDGTLLD